MLKKRNRLKTEKDFLQVLRFGKKIDLADISIYIYQNRSSLPSSSIDFKQMYDEFGNFIGSSITSTMNSGRLKIDNQSKIGIIVSTKNGKAHDRNKFKRRVRNIMRKYISETQSEYIIIKAKGKLVDVTFDAVFYQIQKVFTLQSLK